MTSADQSCSCATNRSLFLFSEIERAETMSRDGALILAVGGPSSLLGLAVKDFLEMIYGLQLGLLSVVMLVLAVCILIWGVSLLAASRRIERDVFRELKAGLANDCECYVD